MFCCVMVLAWETKSALHDQTEDPVNSEKENPAKASLGRWLNGSDDSLVLICASSCAGKMKVGGK